MNNANGKLGNSTLPNPQPGDRPIVTDITKLAGAIRDLQGAKTGIIAPYLRLAITKAGSGTYPTLVSEPNVYGFKFRNVHDYTTTPGLQSVTSTLRHSDTETDDVVLNLAALGGWSDSLYIPEDTDIFVFELAGKWFTWYQSHQFDVRVKPDGSALQKTFDGGATWTDWATIGACS